MPAPVLTTARLVLRPTVEADVGALLAILAQPGVARWWGSYDEARLRDELLGDAEATIWTILEGDQIAGAIQTHEETTPDYRHAAIDLFLAESSQGRGLGPEAIRRVVAHLTDDLGHHRIVIDPSVENAAAIAAYERVGFRRVGVMRRYERRDSEWRDGLLLELVVDAAGRSMPPSSAPGRLRLHQAKPDDVETILPMMIDFNRFEAIVVDEAKLVPALTNLLGDASIGAVWLLERGGDTVGYAVVTFGFDLEWAGRDAWLTELWIVAEARGEGLGRAALAVIEAEATRLGARALHLMVRHENVRARGLYQSAGFEAPRRETLTKRLGGG